MPKQSTTQPAKRGRPAKSQQQNKQEASEGNNKRKAHQQQQQQQQQQAASRKRSGPYELSDSDAPPRRERREGDAEGEGEVEDAREEDTAEEEEEEEEERPENTIPPELLTRLLHEFFEKDDTRLSKDANAAAGKYMDIFVREAIARCVHERPGGFLEVEDLEKIAPQLLMDF